MILLQSIIVYTLFALLLYVNSRLAISDYRLKGLTNPTFSLSKHYWICVLIFCVISGIRWNVGVDFLSYLYDYQQALQGKFVERSRGMEIGYVFITRLFGKLGLHPILYFALLAFPQIYFVMLAAKRRPDIAPYMLIVMVFGTYYLSWMNGIRQMIVACSFIWSIQFVKDKKIVYYLVWIACAYLWHRSSLILIPIYLLAYSRIKWSNTFLNICLLVICIYVGSNPSWIGLMSRFSNLLSFIGYDHYAEIMDELTDGSLMYGHGLFGPRMLMILLSYVMVIVYYPSVCKYFNNDKMVDFYFKLAFIGICLFYLFDSTGVVFRRPVQYFEIFTLPMIAYTLAYLKNKSHTIPFLLLMISSCAYLFLQIYAESNLPATEQTYSLYNFFFFQG